MAVNTYNSTLPHLWELFFYNIDLQYLKLFGILFEIVPL